MKSIALVTNLESRGLLRDTQILNRVLSYFGCNAWPVPYDKEPATTYNLAIHCETIAPEYFTAAPRHWYFCNPEFLFKQDFKLIERNFELILCKTLESYEICTELFPDRSLFVGFTSLDRYVPGMASRFQVLHIGGKSQVKGTQAVIDAWRWKRNGEGLKIPLIVVSSMYEDPGIEGVTVLRDVPDHQIRALQNQSLFHLQPSETEGFGHVLHEALSCDRLLLTTDAPPMNEIESSVKIPPFSSREFGSANLYAVEATDIFYAVKKVAEAAWKNPGSRAEYDRLRKAFQIAMGNVLETLEKPARVAKTASRNTGYVRVAFLGNFEPQESTENQMKWAIERLGHDVVTIQENAPLVAKEIVRVGAGADLFFWVRTPGFLDGVNMETVLKSLKKLGVPSVSLHLDRFWGIPEREPWIGVDAFWKTDWVFTADGGNQEKFAERGVNHHWLVPAVSEVYIHPGTPRDKYACDVGFVGAVDYHTCYPFRPEMIRALQQRYRDRFKVVQGVRGHELNDVYASMKVVVGDCIFAGAPYYWSDRLPETKGRHGLIVHPYIEGMRHTGLIYAAQDVSSLFDSIDQALAAGRMTRQNLVEAGVEETRLYDTWTNRMAEIIRKVLP